MGTNYYFMYNGEKLHIGKSSFGWEFVFQAYPKYSIYDKAGWDDFIHSSRMRTEHSTDQNEKLKNVIIDEDENEIDEMDFWLIVDTAKRQQRYNFAENIRDRLPQILNLVDEEIKKYGSISNAWKDAEGYAVMLGEFS